MATKTLSELVKLHRVVWFKDWNAARPSGDYGKLDDLRKSFEIHGWMQTGDGTVDVEKLPEHLKERAVKERQEWWDTLKGEAKTGGQDATTALATFEEIYVEKGKLLPIDLIGDTGNRRSQAFFAAMVERKKNKLPVSTEIPVVIKVFEDDLARLEAQILENEGKNIGFMEMSPSDKLRAAKKAVEFGASQSRLRQTFKDGTGQKLWATLLLDKRFPELRLFERMCKHPDDEEYIKFGGQSTGDLNALVLRTDPKELAEKNAKLQTQGRGTLAPADQAEIERFFGTAKSTRNEKKIMVRDTIKGLSENFPNLPLRAAFLGVYEDNKDRFARYHAVAPGFNALDDLVTDGDYPPVELILGRLVTTKGEQRAALYKRLLAALDAPAAQPERKREPQKV